MKKILSLVLFVCMLLTCFSLSALADDKKAPTDDGKKPFEGIVDEVPQTYSGTCGDNLTWTLEDGVLNISGIGNMYDYFMYSNNVAPPWYDYCHIINEIVIDVGVTSIGAHAFLQCNNATTISIPGTVKSIGTCSFQFANSLKEIIVPSGVEIIDSAAFVNCKSLETIYLSDTVKIFDADVISSMHNKNLKNIIVDDNNPYFTSIDSIVYNKDVTKLICCPAGKTGAIVIPDTVKTIGIYAFSYNQFDSITIPDGVTEIQYCAFSNCKNLEQVKLPDTVIEIGNYAFAYCDNLVSAELSSNLYKIGWAAFKNDANLSLLYFNGSVPAEYKYLIDHKFINGSPVEYLDTENSIFYGVSDSFVIYYHEGTEGWTTPTWTAPDGNVYNTIMIPNPEIEEEKEVEKDEEEIPSTGFISENFVPVNTYEDTTFSDVREIDWYQEKVKDVYELGLMIGNDNSQFQPTKEMSLEEALTIACRMNSVYFGNEHQFTMTEEHSKWYDPYVDYATSEQNALDEALLDGLGKVGSRAQVIGLFASLMPKEAFPAINEITMDMIPGLSADDPYAEDILLFYRAGIIVGVDAKGTFNPDKPITRAEIAAIATRIADHSRRQTLVLK